MSRTISERINTGSNVNEELLRRTGDNLSNMLRVAMPGIIQSFDPTTQTVTVQPAINEKIRNSDLSVSDVSFPLLLDVPLVIPKAGGYVLTLPIQQGDECLVVFADMCIDAWWSNGGIQNQIEKRRHDLSDAFAMLGVWSQPNIIPNYSTNSAQLRSITGTACISVSGNEIDMIGTVKINGVTFNSHTHNAPLDGGQTSGPS